MREIKTLNGMYDARCRRCLKAVYRLWVAKESPPIGCSEGQDADISKCGAVYNAMVMIVIRQDQMDEPLTEEQTFLLSELGAKGEALLAHIRAGGKPPGHKLREPIYGDTPRAQ